MSSCIFHSLNHCVLLHLKVSSLIHQFFLILIQDSLFCHSFHSHSDKLKIKKKSNKIFLESIFSMKAIQ